MCVLIRKEKLANFYTHVHHQINYGSNFTTGVMQSKQTKKTINKIK